MIYFVFDFGFRLDLILIVVNRDKLKSILLLLNLFLLEIIVKL